MTLTAEMLEKGWRLHDGSAACPIKDSRTVFEAIQRTGRIGPGSGARDFMWEAFSAYRIIEAHGADAEPATEGTLVEIGARVGDTVQPIGGIDFVVTCDHPDSFTGRDSRGYNGPLNMLLKWRIVSRAATNESELARPTPFPASMADLVYDADGMSQPFFTGGVWPEWLPDDAPWQAQSGGKLWESKGWFTGEFAIRVRRREPKRETVRCFVVGCAERVFPPVDATIDLIDGKPDLSTLKIAEDAL